ncbi:MAG TPA: hypothetical protein VMH87_17670 [Pseudomonadales bacterium]|nr:hypothetical protein [Pseudomonadales bacterium]
MNFTRCYTDNSIVGYTFRGRCDCAVVFDSGDVGLPPSTVSGEELFDLWKAAPFGPPNNSLKRSILFFPGNSTGSGLQYAGKFAEKATSGRNPSWGSLAYWSGNDPDVAPIIIFDGAVGAIVNIKQFGLELVSGNSSTIATSLDDFDFEFDDEQGLLRMISAPSKWTAGIFTSPSTFVPFASGNQCTIDFNPGDGFDTGALSINIIPAGFSTIPFEIGYSQLKSLGRGKYQCQPVLRARLFSEDNDGSRAKFAMDPRDSDSNFTSKDYLRSRIEFDTRTSWKSNFVNDKGQPVFFSIPSVSPGIGSLKLELDRQNGEDCTFESASFVPDKNFVLDGVGIASPTRRTKGSSEHRVLLGNAPTEYADCQSGDIFQFQPGNPAEFSTKGESGIIVDDSGYVTTSWLTVVRADKQDPVPYVTEPTKSPLFGQNNSLKKTKEVSNILARERLVYSCFADKSAEQFFVPVFPWLGFIPDSSSGDDNFETSHLASTRLKQLPRQGSKQAKKLFGSLLPTTSTIGITPQGIVAEVSNSDFTALYLGNPDATTNSTGPEFTIRILPPAGGDPQAAKDFCKELQQDLRRNNLFIVISQPEDYAAKLISLSGNAPAPNGVSIDNTNLNCCLGIGDFLLNLDWSAPSSRNKSQKPNPSPILILKYFQGTCIEKLVANPALWACKTHLAPDLGADTINNDIQLPPGPELDNFNSTIWKNPDWQGTLFLNFYPGGLGPLVEVLGAGMGKNCLRFHHFALSFLPVQAKDIASPPPIRIGPASALLHYFSDNAQPPPVQADEQYEPKEDDFKIGTDYGFKVNYLDVGFANSRVASFSADVYVKFSHFFWDPASNDSGGKGMAQLDLKGSYQASKSDSTGDMFQLTATQIDPVIFSNSLLQRLNITDAELTVTSIRPSDANIKRMLTFFIGIKGDLIFNPNQPFSSIVQVDKVHMERVGLEFDYTPATSDVKCRFRADGIQVDLTVGDLKNSLLSICPLTLKGFRVSIGQNLLNCQELGYYPFPWFGDASSLTFHFAFDLELDLGSLGGLAGNSGGLKFPFLLGWRRSPGGGTFGNFGFGIQFPNLSPDDDGFEIGFDQFVAIRADSAELKPCMNGNTIQAEAFALHNARLVVFGKEWPSNSALDLALFVSPADRKMAWIFGSGNSQDSTLVYVGAGQRIKALGGDTAETIIDNYRKFLALEQGTDICSLSDKTDMGRDGWLVLTQLNVLDLAQAWLALSDNPQLYALTLNIVDLFEVGATYRRVNDQLGSFSAEVNLATTLPPLEFGAVSVRLPKVRTDVYTDGGWLFDLSFPWNNDFSGGCQIEVAVFLGTAGLYFGYTSAVATDLLVLADGQYGFDSWPQIINSDYIKGLHAVRAGIALRAGIGRSVDLGVLQGEASLTIYGTLEGAVAFENKDIFSPVVYAIKGTTGIMLQITLQLDLLILQATADLCAYIQFGFELSTLLAYKKPYFYAVQMPLEVSAEVGIHLHFEVWVTIGCVQVKIFDFTYNGTWSIEVPIGSFSQGNPLASNNFTRRPQLSSVKRLASRTQRWMWSSTPPKLGRPRDNQPQVLTIYAMLVPCVANSSDLHKLPGPYVPCAVGQLMLDVKNEFLVLAKFMTAWALDLTVVSSNTQIPEGTIADARKRLRDDDYWTKTAAQIVLANIQKSFDVTVVQAPQDPTGTSVYSVIPAWPGITWKFEGYSDFQPCVIKVPPGRGLTEAGEENASTLGFLEYIRLLTRSFLAEMDRQAKKNSGTEVNPSINWDDFWKTITTPS